MNIRNALPHKHKLENLRILNVSANKLAEISGPDLLKFPALR